MTPRAQPKGTIPKVRCGYPRKEGACRQWANKSGRCFAHPHDIEEGAGFDNVTAPVVPSDEARAAPFSSIHATCATCEDALEHGVSCPQCDSDALARIGGP